MALVIRGKSTCAVCGEVLQKEDRVVATSHFIGDSKDPLFRFSDAAFHQKCFDRWKEKEEFVRRFNSVATKSPFGNGLRHFMGDDGAIVAIEAENKERNHPPPCTP
jgi:hypothetical protein